MNSGNWILDNIANALNTWNEKLAEIWQLIAQSPETFKGGGIWSVVVRIHGALQAIGYALLVLFFLAGVIKTCGNFAEVKRPEVAFKMFVRFALAKGVVTYGMELMMALFQIVQGMITTIMNAAGMGAATPISLPAELDAAVRDLGFLESIPVWAVSLIGSLFIIVLSFIVLSPISLYGHRPGAPFRLCGRTHQQHRQSLSSLLCRCMPGRRGDRTGLHHFFRLRRLPARHRSQRQPRHHGLGLSGRADF